MSRADRLKEEIGWLKLLVAALIAVEASLIAWLAQHYMTASRIVVFLGGLLALLIAGFGVRLNRRAYRLIEKLEDV
jgi:hypothetical protein